MPAPLTIYLARHGDVHNPEALLYGRLPGYYLSELGRNQAKSAGEHLAQYDLSAIYSSPMERAQETAGIITNQRENPLPVTVDERLIEVHCPYDGTPQSELDKINFDLYTDTSEEYEKPHHLRRRLLDFINDMRRQHANQTILAVSHGDIVVSAFMFAKGQDANDIGRTKTQANRIHTLGLPEVYPATASVSTLTYQTDDPDEVPSYSYHRPY
ncbi:MAG: hypothetical protein Phog2KO_33300 [Phototrophicaceae bacterium]